MSIFSRKVQTVGTISEFMSGDWKLSKEEKLTLGSISLMPVATFAADHAYASSQDVIMKAFDPLVDLVQGLSYPLCYLMIAGGFILVIIGQGHRGMQMLKWAAIGYIGLQFAPALMTILVEVGKAMKGAY
jgi:TrbC/VIRB2 pilin